MQTSVDPDQTLHSAASDLVLHCFSMSHLIITDFFRSDESFGAQEAVKVNVRMLSYT